MSRLHIARTFNLRFLDRSSYSLSHFVLTYFCLSQARKSGGADLFICYGGVQLREAVAAKADWLVFNFQELLTSLE